MDIFKLLTSGAKFNQKLSSKTESENSVKEQLSENTLDFFSQKENEAEQTETDILTLEEANRFRKQHSIRVYGDDVPYPFVSFTQLTDRFKMKPFLKKCLAEAAYTSPTPIQMQAIPIILHERELMACAPTGSGKTLAFLLGMIHLLRSPQKEGFRALIISPTRELCHQVI